MRSRGRSRGCLRTVERRRFQAFAARLLPAAAKERAYWCSMRRAGCSFSTPAIRPGQGWSDGNYQAAEFGRENGRKTRRGVSSRSRA
jgi:hypothetical protein